MKIVMKAVILDFETMAPKSLNLKQLQNLEETYHLQWQIHSRTNHNETAERIQDADIVFTNKVLLNRSLLEQAPKLKYVGILATGTNNVDLMAAKDQQILVQNVSGYGTDSVAQHCLMLMLNLAVSFSQYQQDMEKGRWSQAEQFCLLNHPIQCLAGKTLVIVGYGELGQAVAKLANAFSMKVVIAKRPGSTHVDRPDLMDAVQDADFLSLHCALSSETEELINQSLLSSMKSSAFVINTARGGLVNEPDLVEALEQKQIAGAAVDVLSQEPPHSSHPLIQYYEKYCRNEVDGSPLIITPHNAWGAKESRQNLLNIALNHFEQWLKQN